MRTKKVLFTIFGVFAILMGAFAKDNFVDNKDKFKAYASIKAANTATMLGTLVAPAPAPIQFQVEEVLTAVESTHEFKSTRDENSVLAQAKAKAIQMIGLKPVQLDVTLMSQNSIKAIENLQTQTKALDDQIHLDKLITETE